MSTAWRLWCGRCYMLRCCAKYLRSAKTCLADIWRRPNWPPTFGHYPSIWTPAFIPHPVSIIPYPASLIPHTTELDRMMHSYLSHATFGHKNTKNDDIIRALLLAHLIVPECRRTRKNMHLRLQLAACFPLSPMRYYRRVLT
jgi:hypothetical protein